MKIAVLGPSPVPFTVGGVENLLWGLCDAINQLTSHQAELVKIPSREDDFWSLIDSYHTFYKLDLGHFDAVICAKYPTWMIEHENCIYYIAHRLRGLYDTYKLFNLPITVHAGIKEIDAIMRYMAEAANPPNLDSFFEMILSLKTRVHDIPADYFSFPGPFIRSLVHYMDNYAMSKNAPQSYYCISETVKMRAEYFPADAKVQVAYPPSSLKDFYSGEYNQVVFS